MSQSHCFRLSSERSVLLKIPLNYVVRGGEKRKIYSETSYDITNEIYFDVELRAELCEMLSSIKVVSSNDIKLLSVWQREHRLLEYPWKQLPELQLRFKRPRLE